MQATQFGTLDLSCRREWREWLLRHHDAEPGIWLVFHKGQKVDGSMTYDDAVEEALCFGWIDSIVKRLDDDRYARKFTPRKPDSKWSTINRRRYEAVKARGLLTAAGLDRPPTARSGDAPRPSLSVLPPYIEKQLRANGRAWDYFERLAPSCKRAYLAWIDSAKRDETKERRLREAVGMLAAGKKLELK